MTERKVTLRVRRLGDPEEDEETSHLTPGERMELCWRLTVEAWAICGRNLDEERMDRSVVRILRRGR